MKTVDYLKGVLLGLVLTREQADELTSLIKLQTTQVLPSELKAIRDYMLVRRKARGIDGDFEVQIDGITFGLDANNNFYHVDHSTEHGNWSKS